MEHTAHSRPDLRRVHALKLPNNFLSVAHNVSIEKTFNHPIGSGSNSRIRYRDRLGSYGTQARLRIISAFEVRLNDGISLVIEHNQPNNRNVLMNKNEEMESFHEPILENEVPLQIWQAFHKYARPERFSGLIFDLSCLEYSVIRQRDEISTHFRKQVKDDGVRKVVDNGVIDSKWKMDELNPNKKLEDYDYEVWQHPDWKGGQPVIKGTRWPVWDIYGAVNLDGVEDTIEGFETLNREMVEFAVKYVEQNPEVAMFYADEED